MLETFLQGSLQVFLKDQPKQFQTIASKISKENSERVTKGISKIKDGYFKGIGG